MSRFIIYNSGEQVGNAIYLNEANFAIKRRMAQFRCQCGNKFYAPLSKVKSYETLGCGCMKGKNPNSRNHTTHGAGNHKLYNVWNGMKARCYNKNRQQYKDYGGKGVTVCDEWKGNFRSFYDWAISNGWSEGLQLDKDIKGNGLIYSPENCCFVTPKVNSNKRKSSRILEYNGQKKTVPDWAEVIGISAGLIHCRISRGLSIDKVLSVKVA